jgi:sec-independent protein translocase protein TatA
MLPALSHVGFLDFSAPELIIILAIVLLLFGGKKLPQLSRSLGDSMREIRKGLSDNTDDKKSEQHQNSQKQQESSTQQ